MAAYKNARWRLTIGLIGCVLAAAAAGVGATDITALPDVSGDGEPDIATFAETLGGDGISVTLFSGASGLLVGTINYLDNRYEGRALERIAQMPTTGLPRASSE